MNAKKCKALREAAGYKNASKTGSQMKFPGVAKLLQFPLVERNPNGKIKTSTRKVFTGRWWQNDVYPKRDAEGKMATDVVPTSKPGRHEMDTPRGKYRALKKLERTVGLDNIVKSGVEKLVEEQGEPT